MIPRSNVSYPFNPSDHPYTQWQKVISGTCRAFKVIMPRNFSAFFEYLTGAAE
jgi:hypothetical protein